MKVKVKYNLLRASISVFLALAIVIVAGFSSGINAYAATALTVIDNGTNIVVETGSGLVYKINKTNGNLVSAQLNGGAELQDQTKGSQINSGLTTPTVTYQTFDSGSQVLITCATSTVTHYYASKAGDNTIYMATYTTAEHSTKELYYVFRGNNSVLTNVPTYSDLRGNTGAVQTDVYGFSDGHTASKYYGNDQAKDLTIRGVTGNDVGVFMAYGNRETSIGGPFQRNVQFQTNNNVEIYNYMNSQYAQTDVVTGTSGTGASAQATYGNRKGLFGPYALCFTNGATPSLPDYSWMSGLGLLGNVSDSNRGSVTLTGLTGMASKYKYTIGFANTTAQYWASASSTGVATVTEMKPGIYTMTVYKGELAVATQSVTVTAGNTTIVPTIAIGTGDPSTTQTIWRIGDWDGTPLEFDNGKNIQYQHPSDSRNDSWGTSYTIGDSYSNFPAAQFRKVNGNITITFNMDQSQIASDHVLKIGYTTALTTASTTATTSTTATGIARPSFKLTNSLVTANGPTTVYNGIPEPISPTITLGTYRGNNAIASYTIAKGNWAAGQNTITIMSPSNATKDGLTYLSGSYTFDCIELEGIPVNAVTGVAMSPSNDMTLVKGANQQFTATASGIGTFDDTIKWSLSTTTGASVNTEISSTGLLAIDADEKSSSLTVRATSNTDKNIYSEVKVKLVNPFEHAINYDLTNATVNDIDINTDTNTTGAAVTVTFAAEAGYKLPDEVSVGIDGVDSPIYDYDSKTGILFVENVTGDLTIKLVGANIVTTIGTSNVGQHNAVLKGIIDSGNETVLQQGFEWRTTSGGSYNQIAGTLDGENLTVNLTGLNLYTSYTFRAYAKTSTGTGYGDEETFRTGKGTSTISNISSSGGSSSSGILGTLEGEESDESEDSTSAATSTITSSSSDTSTTLGQMGWVKTSDNNWYHVDSSTGSKNTGWLKAQDGNWYYLDKTIGAMQTGWEQTDDGNWYYLHNTTGAMQTGWLQAQDGIWYYLDKTTGAMKTGWIKTGEKWYYLNSNGSLAVNTTVNGYLVNKSGEWIN